MAWCEPVICCLGGVNGLYQIMGELLEPIRNKMESILGLHKESFSHKFINVAGTFILVDFSWIFFRAQGIREALDIIKNLFTVNNPWILFDGSLYTCGLNQKNFNLMLLCIEVLFIADFCKRKGMIIRKKIMLQDYWFQITIIVLSTVAIATFGIWGGTYDAARFIYFQF